MEEKKTRKKGKFAADPKKKPVLPVILGLLAVLAAAVFAVFMLLDPGAAGTDTPGSSGAAETGEQTAPTGAQEETEPLEEPSPETGTAVRSEDVVNAYLDDRLHLILVLKDGSEVDQGYVGDNTGEQTYVIVFADHDGTVLKTESVISGTDATPPADPVREGYTFVGWDGSYTGVSGNGTLTAQYRQNEPDAQTFVVTFVDGSGNVLKTQVVEKGSGATAPGTPVREGYEFTGWDQAFDRVEADLTVTAQFSPVPDTEPALYAADVSAAPGESVQVPVMVKNNPGVAGARIVLTFDEGLQLTAAASGEAFAALDYTAPAGLASGCAFNWDSLDAESAVDGTVLVLTFAVPADAAAGDRFAVRISYRNGDIYDADLNIVAPAAGTGTITVE